MADQESTKAFKYLSDSINIIGSVASIAGILYLIVEKSSDQITPQLILKYVFGSLCLLFSTSIALGIVLSLKAFFSKSQPNTFVLYGALGITFVFLLYVVYVIGVIYFKSTDHLFH